MPILNFQVQHAVYFKLMGIDIPKKIALILLAIALSSTLILAYLRGWQSECTESEGKLLAPAQTKWLQQILGH